MNMSVVSGTEKEDLRICRSLNKKHGLNYYYAAAFFPAELRRSVYALYAFLRVPDEIADNNRSGGEERIKAELSAWLGKWRAACRKDVSDEPVLRSALSAFRRHNIPYGYSEDFFRSMFMDSEKREYANYAELREYMYGSACVVGLMLCYIIGFNDPRALEYASCLGEAMQLTNFLRDIDEDYRQRGRIYMPRDELAACGLSREDIARRRFSPAFRDFMKLQVERSAGLYRRAQPGIAMLDKRGRLAVRVASAFYSRILVKIKQMDYNIFLGRARSGTAEKTVLALRTLLTLPGGNI